MRRSLYTFGILFALCHPLASEELPHAAPEGRREKPCENFPIGTRRHLGGEQSNLVSAGGERFVLARSGDPAGEWRLFDHKDHRQIRSGNAGFNPTATELSPSGKLLVMAGFNSETKILAPSSGTELFRKVIGGGGVWRVSFSPDERYVAVLTNDRVHIIDVESKSHTQTLLSSRTLGGVAFSPDGKLVAVYESNGVIIYELPEGKLVKRLISLNTGALSFSADGRTVLVVGDHGVMRAIDIDSKEEKWALAFPKHADQTLHNARVAFSPDLKTAVIGAKSWADGGQKTIASVVDVVSGRVIRQHEMGSAVRAVRFAPDGSTYAIFAGEDGSAGQWDAYLFETKSGVQNVRTRLPAFYGFVLGSQPPAVIADSYLSREAWVRTLEVACVDTTWKLSREGRDAPKVNVAALCAKGFEAAAWDKAIPLPQGTLSPEEARLWLLRFQKPKGLDLTRHLPILFAILKDEKYVDENSALVVGALEGTLLVSNLLYEALLGRFPFLKNLKSAPVGDDESCRTSEERGLVAKGVIDYVGDLRATHSRPTLADLSPLGPLRGTLSKLPRESKEDLIHQITNDLADSAADTKELQGIFHSKIYYFVKQAVGKWFGEAPRQLTDLTLVREAGRLVPHLLGVNQIDAETQVNSFGFHKKQLAPISVDSLAEHPVGPIDLGDRSKVRWRHGGKPFTADIGLTIQQQRDLAPHMEAPPYDDLWAGGKLTGIVITGTNLRSEGPQVMRSYRQYYEAEGFTFGTPKRVDDVHRFLRESVESGELRYLIKEAHSDGDEKNLFRLDKVGDVATGTRRNADGSQEVVYLVSPVAEKKETVLLGNDEFGQWLRNRETNGHGSLVYFNTSCWSTTKALNEIESAGTKKFINIPSTTMVSPFSYYEGDAERLMLDGFRRKESYKQIRSRMERNDAFKKRTGNVFIFPDESDYERQIRQLVKIPMEIKIRVRDSDGREYHLDQAR